MVPSWARLPNPSPADMAHNTAATRIPVPPHPQPAEKTLAGSWLQTLAKMLFLWLDYNSKGAKPETLPYSGRYEIRLKIDSRVMSNQNREPGIY